MGIGDYSSLTEPKIKHFISVTLRECRQFKDNNMNILFNVLMCLLFIAVISGFLMYKYKGKLTPKEIMEKNRVKQEYLISKLQQMSIERKRDQELQDTITNLPTFDRY
jgi:hypothetical protein